MNIETIEEIERRGASMAARLAPAGLDDARAGVGRARRRRRAASSGAVAAAGLALAIGGWWVADRSGTVDPAETDTPLEITDEPLELQLSDAIRAGDERMVRALATVGVYLDNSDMPYAAFAMEACDLDMLATLESVGVPRVFPDDPWTDVALVEAARFCGPDVIEEVYVDASHWRASESVLAEAVHNDSPEVLATLVDLGVRIEHPEHFTALSYAIEAVRLDMLEELLELGADPWQPAGFDTPADIVEVAQHTGGDEFADAIRSAREESAS